VDNFVKICAMDAKAGLALALDEIGLRRRE
jgi:hypothetical protein